MWHKPVVLDDRDGLGTAVQVTLGVAVGLAAVALLWNAKDISQYLKFVGMSTPAGPGGRR